jgi:hypothetical protein
VTWQAFEGPAGSGKTYELLSRLERHLASNPLKEGQRVLATTYMHGSRRKLEASLRKIHGLAGRFECSTVDSIALRLSRRWHDFGATLGLPEPGDGEFDQVCQVAANLASQPCVRGWLSTSFPVAIVDEAQDLTTDRLAIVRGLSERSCVYIAGDEFQCLQDDLRPTPFAVVCEKGSANVTRLAQIRRTNIAALLEAAAALRDGKAPQTGKALKITAAPSAALAGTYMSNAVCWNGGEVAILTPSITAFVRSAIDWAQNNKTRQNQGPIRVSWERAERDERTEVLGKLRMPDVAAIEEVHACIERMGVPSLASDVHAWVERQRNAMGRSTLRKDDVAAAVTRALNNRRRFGKGLHSKTSAMTIQTAKNREFDGVVVLWPHQVGGDDLHKRRLLYNAITRARKWACVLVQSDAILSKAPFA